MVVMPHNSPKGGGGVKVPWKSVITGGLAGLANGFFGAGGGLFLVPLFTRWLHMKPKQAFATSVAVIFPLSAVAAWLWWRRTGIDVSIVWPYLVGGAVGGLCSGRVFQKISVLWLRRAFGALLIYGGIRAVFLL